jgi:cytochrome c551/c552
LLEYGSGWFSKNADSGLGYIEYNSGNRPPLIDQLIVDKTSGQLPLSITATVKAKDRENDSMTYTWDLGNGVIKETTEPQISHSYAKAGDYRIKVEVKDTAGESAKSNTVTIVAGNARPVVTIDIMGGNTSFFVPGQEVQYAVSVTDKDGNEAIQEDKIFVSVDYLEGMDKVAMSSGHQQVSAEVTGKALTQSMDCKTCHKELEASIGPNYTDIAQKYKKQRDAIAYLKKKIVSGGTGVWGEVMMPAHPDISSEEARQIAMYITSLAANGIKKVSLPVKGKIRPETKNPGEVMVITASYTDEGAEGAIPLTGASAVALSSNTVGFSKATKTKDMTVVTFGGQDLLVLAGEQGWFEIDDIDLTGVNMIVLGAGWQEAPKAAYHFDVRLDAPDGDIIGKGSLGIQPQGVQGGAIVIPFTAKPKGKHKIYVTGAVQEGETPSTFAIVNTTFN